VTPEQWLAELERAAADEWRAACEHDEAPVRCGVVVFTPENPHARRLDDIMAAVGLLRRLVYGGG
jgi:hypothetical protein